MTSYQHSKFKVTYKYRAKKSDSKGFIPKSVQKQVIQEPCKHCGSIDIPSSADHIFPVVFGGDSNIDNLQCLCTSCHSMKTKEEQKILKALQTLKLAEKCGSEMYYYITEDEVREFYNKYGGQFVVLRMNNIINDWGKFL